MDSRRRSKANCLGYRSALPAGERVSQVSRLESGWPHYDLVAGPSESVDARTGYVLVLYPEYPRVCPLAEGGEVHVTTDGREGVSVYVCRQLVVVPEAVAGCNRLPQHL